MAKSFHKTRKAEHRKTCGASRYFHRSHLLLMLDLPQSSLLWHERLLQPKEKDSPCQILDSSAHLGSSGVRPENGAKSALPRCVPETKKTSYTCEMWGKTDPRLHTSHWTTNGKSGTLQEQETQNTRSVCNHTGQKR